MPDPRDEFLRHKEQALAAKREGRNEEARVHFLAAAKALLGLAEKVKSPEEKATLAEAARALVAKAKELKGAPSTDADLVQIEAALPAGPREFLIIAILPVE